MSLARQFVSVAMGLSCAVALAGCSKPGNHAKIHGNVKLDGQPLAAGSIRFIPMSGTPGAVTGGDIKDGRYEIALAKGPAIGRNRVEINAMRPTGKHIENKMLPPGQTAEVYESVVAPRFNTESTFETVVQTGDNTADFDVESK